MSEVITEHRDWDEKRIQRLERAAASIARTLYSVISVMDRGGPWSSNMASLRENVPIDDYEASK